MYFNSQQQQRKIRKTTIIWKLNFTSGWAYIRGGLITGIFFCLQVDGPITGGGLLAGGGGLISGGIITEILR